MHKPKHHETQEMSLMKQDRKEFAHENLLKTTMAM
jgi:hypothetical protein